MISFSDSHNRKVHNVFKIVSLKLPTVLFVGKGGKYAVTTI